MYTWMACTVPKYLVCMANMLNMHITLHKLQRSQYIKELSSTMRRVGPQLTTHLFGVMQQHTVCVLLCLIVGQIVTV